MARGTRTARPSNLAAYCGRALVAAIAAPVEDGIRLAAAALPRRRFLFGRSTIAWVIGMHRGHDGLLHSNASSHHLNDRGNAVRGATGAGNDAGRWAVCRVDPVDHSRGLRAFGGCREDDRLGAGRQVTLQVRKLFKHPGAFQHRYRSPVSATATVQGLVPRKPTQFAGSWPKPCTECSDRRRFFSPSINSRPFLAQPLYKSRWMPFGI